MPLPGRWPRLQQQPAQLSFSFAPFASFLLAAHYCSPPRCRPCPFLHPSPGGRRRAQRARCSCCECELRSFVCCFVFILAAMMTELFARALLSRSQTQVLGNLPGAERARVASNQRRVARPSEPIRFAPSYIFVAARPPLCRLSGARLEERRARAAGQSMHACAALFRWARGLPGVA